MDVDKESEYKEFVTKVNDNQDTKVNVIIDIEDVKKKCPFDVSMSTPCDSLCLIPPLYSLMSLLTMTAYKLQTQQLHQKVLQPWSFHWHIFVVCWKRSMGTTTNRVTTHTFVQTAPNYHLPHS